MNFQLTMKLWSTTFLTTVLFAILDFDFLNFQIFISYSNIYSIVRCNIIVVTSYLRVCVQVTILHPHVNPYKTHSDSTRNRENYGDFGNFSNNY